MEQIKNNIIDNEYNCYFPMQCFVFDDIKNIYIYCDNNDSNFLKTSNNSLFTYPKIIYIKQIKQNLWMDSCYKIQCYGFKDKNYNSNNLLIKYQNNILNNDLETYIHLFNIDNFTSFKYKTYIYLELTENLHILIQWLEFWNIVQYLNNEFITIILQKNIYPEINMTFFDEPTIICKNKKLRMGYDPLSITQVENVNNNNNNNIINYINVNQIINMTEESQSILFDENEDESYPIEDEMSIDSNERHYYNSNEEYFEYEDDIVDDDDNDDDFDDNDVKTNFQLTDEENKYDNDGNYIINESEINWFSNYDYNPYVNAKQESTTIIDNNSIVDFKQKNNNNVNSYCSICLKESNHVLLYNNVILRLDNIKTENDNKNIKHLYFVQKNEFEQQNYLLGCPCKNEKHFICLYCLYRCYLSELNVIIEIGYDNYYNNNPSEKIKNVSMYRYCFEPSTKITKNVNNTKITEWQLNNVMDWIEKYEQIDILLKISKLKINDLLAGCKNILWYFYDENQITKIDDEQKKLTFEHFLNIPSIPNLLLNKYFIEKIWYQIKKILNTEKVTVTCPECKQEIEKISDCNAVRHCNIDICYFCGIFSRKYDYLPSKHWDENGLTGCPRYYEDKFCTNNKINYLCKPDECYNYDYTCCENFIHLKGKYYLDLTRQYNMLYHKINSLPELIKIEINNMLNTKLMKIKSKSLYRYKKIENEQKSIKKIILIQWLLK